jgi:6-pyruvoyltetrahydropterin/6-carboxytetrahydropterin synthase
MLNVTITRKFEFAAAHFLPHHGGVCHDKHGHNYMLEVTVSSNREPGIYHTSEEKGMVCDFSCLKDIVTRYVISRVDHSSLNQTFNNPTAENMVTVFSEWLKDGFKKEGRKDIVLVRLRLWETSNSYSEWSEQ